MPFSSFFLRFSSFQLPESPDISRDFPGSPGIYRLSPAISVDLLSISVDLFTQNPVGAGYALQPSQGFYYLKRMRFLRGVATCPPTEEPFIAQSFLPFLFGKKEQKKTLAAEPMTESRLNKFIKTGFRASLVLRP